MKNQLKSEMGYTLTELMIVVGILGIVALMMSSMLRQQQRAIGHMEKRVEVMELKEYLFENVNCFHTIKVLCKSRKKGSMLRGHDGAGLRGEGFDYETKLAKDFNFTRDEAAGKIQIPADAKPRWTLFPYCKKGDVFVEYARKLGPVFMDDPLTGKPMNYKPLFKSSLCSSKYLGASECDGDGQVSAINFDTGEVFCRPLDSGDVDF